MNAQQLKAKFESEGRTFAGWARDNGYSRIAVYQVVNGQSKAKYGTAHEIAVKLGLKVGSIPASTNGSGRTGAGQ